MKLYKSHKIVAAAVIMSVLADEEPIRYVLDDGDTVEHPKGTNYVPNVGDYYVMYDGGYASLSPKKAFEDGYLPHDPNAIAAIYTLYNHGTLPNGEHCCGCFNVVYDHTGLYSVCNECGVKHDLSDHLFVGQKSVSDIATVCHEANRAICEAFGDLSQKPWAEAEQWQRDSAIAGVRFAMEHPDAPASAQHDAWAADKLRDGWTYGPVKNPAAKEHPCLVAYEELPPEQRVKDYVFKAVVNSLAPKPVGVSADEPELPLYEKDRECQGKCGECNCAAEESLRA